MPACSLLRTVKGWLKPQESHMGEVNEPLSFDGNLLKRPSWESDLVQRKEIPPFSSPRRSTDVSLRPHSSHWPTKQITIIRKKPPPCIWPWVSQARVHKRPGLGDETSFIYSHYCNSCFHLLQAHFQEKLGKEMLGFFKLLFCFWRKFCPYFGLPSQVTWCPCGGRY